MPGDSGVPNACRTIPRRVVWDLVRTAITLAIIYLLAAYLLLPYGWRHYERRHPALDDLPRITRTQNGIPADPLNVAFVGSEEDLHRAILAARWYPADPVTLRSSLRIAADAVFRRSYEDAPVSSLYLWDRKQDFAFERSVGNDPRRRHHVRFWHAEQRDEAGRLLWIGAATFDSKVGLSHTTGQITHHIAAEVDLERDTVIADVQGTGDLDDLYWVDGFQPVLDGKNGGGDPWHTDGRLAVGVLKGFSLGDTISKTLNPD